MSIFFKKFIVALFSCIALIAMSSLSLAAQGDLSAGLKFGNMDIDTRGAGSEAALGVHFGYRASPRVSAELEILQADFNGVDVDSTAIYGTYRSTGDMYFLGKIGFVTLDMGNDDDSGLSYGFGGGLSLGNGVAIEAEYTILDSDVSFFGVTGKLTF